MKLIDIERLKTTAQHFNNNFLQYVYPVNSIIYTNNNINPSKNLGGIWTLLNDRDFFIRANSTNYGRNTIIIEKWAEHNHTVHSAIYENSFNKTNAKFKLKVVVDSAEIQYKVVAYHVGLGLYDWFRLTGKYHSGYHYAIKDASQGHTHTISYSFDLQTTSTCKYTYVPEKNQKTSFVGTENQEPISIIPPYIQRYIWKRTA